MRVLIVFDIADDRRRAKIVKVLLARSDRVQKSVFEARELGVAAYLRLRSDLEGLVDPMKDDLRYYRLCARCAAGVEHHGCGVGLLDDKPGFEIVGDPPDLAD